MSESYEPSYYEIALTNRQVVVAFVILLICLMGTFFAGVWVGRGEAQAAAPATPQQQSAGDGGIEPLDFFGGGDEPAADAGAAGTERPPAQSRREPSREEDRGTPRDEASGGEGAALPSTAAALPPSGGDAAQQGPEPTQTPTPRQSAPQTAPPQRAVPAAGAPVEGPVVQVFSSAEREQAQKVRDRLVDGGQPAYLSPVEVDGRTMYRVRIGPFRDRDEAEKVADAVRHEYKYDTWITQ